MDNFETDLHLDPWDFHSRDRLTEVLNLLGLSLELDAEITEGGGNLSMAVWGRDNCSAWAGLSSGNPPQSPDNVER